MRLLTIQKVFWISVIFCLSFILAACGTPATPTSTGGTDKGGEATPSQPADSYPAPNMVAPTPVGYPAPGQAPQAAPTSALAYPAPAGSSGGAQLILVKPDGASATLNLDSLQSLTLTQVSAGGQVENGYKLVDILKSTSVDQFQQVTVISGEKSIGFASADLPDDAILSFSDPANITLAASSLPADQWLKGVTRVEVK